jgi:hypothetical protein
MGQVARLGEKRHAYKTLVGKLDGTGDSKDLDVEMILKQNLERPSCENIIKTDLRKT